ncbi:LolA family protein [Aggregatimonas sangjinii]|nr:outer membrane lipoprotein carrier protein LolA [Aggregatimonas sangjinii]
MHKSFTLPSVVPTKWSICLLVLCSLLSTTVLSAQTKMNTADAVALRQKVKEQAESTKTVSSDFKQFKHLDFLSNDIESNGKLFFKAPDLVKWEYTEPFAYSILFKNQTLYINDDGNKSNMDVGSNKIFKQLNELITSSIRGDMFDEEQFTISYFTKDEDNLVYFLPKDEQFAEFIKAFHITFNTNGEVDEVKMIEPSGDYTQILFSNRILNQPLSDADFAQ